MRYRSDGRAYRIIQPSIDYESDRGINQVGLVYNRDGFYLCAFTGKKVDALRSWYRREYTPEEVRSEVPYMFARFCGEDGCFGVLWSAQAGRHHSEHLPTVQRRQRKWLVAVVVPRCRRSTSLCCHCVNASQRVPCCPQCFRCAVSVADRRLRVRR